MISKLTDEELQKVKQHIEEVTKKEVVSIQQIMSMKDFGYVIGFVLENYYWFKFLVDDFEQVIRVIDEIFDKEHLKRFRKRKNWWLDYKDLKHYQDRK